jgi:hypothetical protein
MKQEAPPTASGLNEKLRQAIDHRIDEIRYYGTKYTLPGHEELRDTSDHTSSGFDNFIQYKHADVKEQIENVRADDGTPADVWVDAVWTHGRVDLDDFTERYEDNILSESELVKARFVVTMMKGTKKIETCLYREHRSLFVNEKQQLLKPLDTGVVK